MSELQEDQKLTQEQAKRHLKVLQDTKAKYMSSKQPVNPTLDDLLDCKVQITSDLDLHSNVERDYINVRKHVSFSEIATWMDCAHKHKLKYLDTVTTEKDGPSVHTEYGQVIHDVLEEYLRTRVMMPTEQIHKMIDERFAALPVNPEAKPIKRAEWHDTVEPILNEIPSFMEESFGKDWKYVAAELPLLEAMDKHQHMFKGFIDGVIEGVDGRGNPCIWIIDWKTVGFFWPTSKRIDPKKTFQLVYYKHFFSRKTNTPLKDIRCGFVLLRRSKKPGNCELVTVSVGDKAVEKALATIDSMFGHIKKKMFPKNRTDCKLCPYNNTEHCT